MLTLSVYLNDLLGCLGRLGLSHLLNYSTLYDLPLSIDKLSLSIDMYQLLAWLSHNLLLNHLACLATLLDYLPLTVDLEYLALVYNLLLRNSILCWLRCLALLPAGLLCSSSLCRGQLQR